MAALAATAVGVCVWTAPADDQPVARVAAGGGGTAIGSAGCASANCHGQPAAELLGKPGPDAWKKSSHVWSAFDPHSRATAVLDPKQNATAARMVAAFQKSNPGFNPQTDARCLACHTNPALAESTDAQQVALRGEGVGCEACHGNADRWQVPHYQWATATRATEMTATGMTELNDHAARAKVCAGCHVGAPADKDRGYPVRDMNHDMIAAGHPRLIFDYSTHLLRLPRHWQEKDRAVAGTPARDATVELRAWIDGELAGAVAQAELAADRATRKAPWPELAEFNCYSCHHDLVPQSWRAKAGVTPGRTPGRPGWDLPWPVTELAGADAKRLVGELNKAKTADEVKKAADELTKLLRKVNPAGGAAVIRKSVEDFTKSNRPVVWDDAYRAYLALNALELLQADYPQRPAVRKELNELGEKLLFLPAHPRESGKKPEDPVYNPVEVVKRIGEILKQIP